MTSFNDLLQQGTAHAWLFIPTAILLGALHGLEPGHSKTMMAAFIIAIRGTIGQAVLLGLSAAFSHSLVIWALAAAALKFGSHWTAERTEPYFQIASGAIIVAMAAWMFWRTRRDTKLAAAHRHDDEGPHGGKIVDTGHGLAEITVFETNVPPRFRLFFFDPKRAETASPPAADITVETTRGENLRQKFTFVAQGAYIEATEELPEPHEFEATLAMAHGGHTHVYPFRFEEDEHHHHSHAGLDVSDGEFQDAHERAHASDIASRFKDRTVSTGQIVLFGLTGGLLPCPAALTILLVCLQLKQVTLGFTLVLCFSIGLALTLVTTGAIAAWGVNHASKRIKGFGEFARKAPYFSSALLTLLGLFFAWQGWRHL